MGKPAMLEMVNILLYSGVFDRHPKLRIGLIESGVGWMPWACEYMDRAWEMQRHWTGVPNKQRPSFYFDQNVYASFIEDPVGVELRHKTRLQEHHVVVGLSAFGNHVPAFAQGDRPQLQGRAQGGNGLDPGGLRGEVLRVEVSPSIPAVGCAGKLCT